MGVDIKKLKKQLLSKIDQSDLVQVEKVERYINLVKLNDQLDESIKVEGITVVTINGSQRFLKSNPALAEKAKINTALLHIEKSFNFDVKKKTYSRKDLLLGRG